MYATIKIDLDRINAMRGHETAHVASLLRTLADRLERRPRCESPIGLDGPAGQDLGLFEVHEGCIDPNHIEVGSPPPHGFDSWAEYHLSQLP